MSETLDRLEAEGKERKTAALQELWNSCTAKQQAFFNRVYESVKLIPEDEQDSVIKLLERTIRKNKV